MARNTVQIMLSKDIKKLGLHGTLSQAIRDVAGKNTYRMMQKAVQWTAKEHLSDPKTAAGILGYSYNITGNLYASIGFLMTRYDANQQRRMRSYWTSPMGKKKPLRNILKEKEPFLGKVFYDGTPAFEHPYVAMTRFGNTYQTTGDRLRMEFVQKLLSSQADKARGQFMWSLNIFIAAPYARVVEASHGHERGAFVMAIADLVRSNIKEYKNSSLPGQY